MLYSIYALSGTVLCWFLQLLSPLARLGPERIGYRIAERFARYPELPRKSPSTQTLWLHAASVGEVQAACRLIEALEAQSDFLFFVTVTSEQGHRMAEKRLKGSAVCGMAPLDAPFIIRRAIAHIRPDLFICVETELWPVLLTLLARQGVRMCLVNGRMSARSFGRYIKFRSAMERLLTGFAACAVITRQDRDRFVALGVPENRILVSGNTKYGFAPVDPAEVRTRYRHLLGIEEAVVFLCGSIRTGEIELLLPVVEQLYEHCDDRLVWIIAPRHLENIAPFRALLENRGYIVALFSEGRAPRADIILVDCMGELAELYAVGDFNFCGGSLVDRGGHNIMEIVRWGLPPYFGPYMHDFQDAVAQVVSAGAGFQVRDNDEFATLLKRHLKEPAAYSRACRAARQVAGLQGEAVRRQTQMVLRLLQENDSITPVF